MARSSDIPRFLNCLGKRLDANLLWVFNFPLTERQNFTSYALDIASVNLRSLLQIDRQDIKIFDRLWSSFLVDVASLAR